MSTKENFLKQKKLLRPGNRRLGLVHDFPGTTLMASVCDMLLDVSTK